MASVVIDIVGASVGVGGLGFGVWRDLTARRHDRERDAREAETEADRARHQSAKDAARSASRTLDACFDLNDLLADWHRAVNAAVEPAETPGATLASLDDFMQGYDFENRLRRHLAKIPDPEGRELRRLASGFRRTALRSKGTLSMRLQSGEFGRVYDKHKDEAIELLTQEYRSFQLVLDELTGRLRETSRQEPPEVARVAY